MNYKRLYDNIISNRKQNKPIGYYERHHIIPRSLGGSDCSSNIIALTAREHFICHYLLAKMYPKYTFEWYKTNHAFLMMKAASSTHERYFNSHLYESLRKNMTIVMSNAQSGKKNSQFGTFWICNVNTMENKKIPKFTPIPSGWKKGRVVDWSKKNKKVDCKHCNTKFIRKTKELFCTTQCRKDHTNPFLGKEEEFLSHYFKCSHIGKSLKLCGFPGNWSIYNRWARKTIEAYQKNAKNTNGIDLFQRGKRAHSAKLTEENVRYIKNNFVKNCKEFGASALSRKFGVSQTAILSIIHGRTWTHIK